MRAPYPLGTLFFNFLLYRIYRLFSNFLRINPTVSSLNLFQSFPHGTLSLSVFLYIYIIHSPMSGPLKGHRNIWQYNILFILDSTLTLLPLLLWWTFLHLSQIYPISLPKITSFSNLRIFTVFISSHSVIFSSIFRSQPFHDKNNIKISFATTFFFSIDSYLVLWSFSSFFLLSIYFNSVLSEIQIYF